MNDKDKVLSVLTFKSVQTILDVAGTQSWLLDPKRAAACRYCVVCRNAYHESVEDEETHGTAFMIGVIKDIVPSTETKGRWLVRFSEYSVDDFGNQWEGRNPVAYGTVDDYAGSKDWKRIDFAGLDFKPMPEQLQAEDDAVEELGLSLAEAKAAVALRYGVDPVAVEICVRA